MKRKSVLKVRRNWKINPRTRVKTSQKVYDRKKEKSRVRKQLKQDPQ